MSRIRIAMIGCGRVAQQHVRAWKLYPREVEIVALCDRVRAKAEETRKVNKLPGARVLTDWRELVDDPSVDAVDVCTYSDLHDDILAAFMPAGKHVATEKPVGYTLENCRRLRYFIKHNPKVKVQVAYSLRYYPVNIEVKRLVAEGAVGKVLHAEVTHMHPHEFKARETDWVADRAAWGIETSTDSGGRYVASGEMIHTTHAFDLIRYILSDEPFDVFSLSHTAGAYAMIRFVKGALGLVTSGSSATQGIPNVAPVLVQGTEGTIYTSWNHFDNPKDPVLTAYLVSRGKRRVIRRPQDSGHGDRTRVRNFIDALTKNAPLICDLEDGIRTSELLHALWDSQSHEIRVPMHRRTQTG